MLNVVLLKDLADEFGLDKSNMRRYALRQGFQPIKVRTPESRGQKTLALPNEDAEAIRALRDEQGFLSVKSINDNGAGWFYVIQLLPDLKPDRVKLGFTNDVDSRLRAHRTAAPTAEVLHAWPCKRTWEIAVIDCITQAHCSIVGFEVFDCEELDALIEKAETFFSLMPCPY